MTVEQEEKLLKGVRIFTVLSMLPLNYIVNRYSERDDAELPFAILISSPVFLLTSAMLVLTFRKFKRDKTAGKDLKRYSTMMYFIITGLLTGLGFVIYALYTT